MTRTSRLHTMILLIALSVLPAAAHAGEWRLSEPGPVSLGFTVDPNGAAYAVTPEPEITVVRPGTILPTEVEQVASDASQPLPKGTGAVLVRGVSFSAPVAPKPQGGLRGASGVTPAFESTTTGSGFSTSQQ